MNPLFEQILEPVTPRPHCEHDWKVTGYSYVDRRAAQYDPGVRPEFVYLLCQKCGEETMEEFD